MGHLPNNELLKHALGMAKDYAELNGLQMPSDISGRIVVPKHGEEDVRICLFTAGCCTIRLNFNNQGALRGASHLLV